MYNTNPFTKATAVKLPIKALVMGESGTGKTWSALAYAKELATLEGGKVALIDSEGGRARFYAPFFDFDHMIIPDNSPKSYIEAIRAAEKFGYKVLIVDSFSHAWSGEGGVLDIVDKAKTGWAVGKPEHHKLVAAIQKARIHIIGTVRIKNSYDKTEGGSVIWESAKVDARQESEFEYEFDVSFVLDRNHNAAVRMSKCYALKSGEVVLAGEHTAAMETLYNWANAGDDPPKWYDLPEAKARLRDVRKKLLASKVSAPIVDNAITACLDYDRYIDIDDYLDGLRSTVKDLQEHPYNISKLDPSKTLRLDDQAKLTGTANEPGF